MTPNGEQTGFTPRGARRVSLAAERTERFDRARYNGTGPSRSHRQVPKQRTGYVVRITGQPSMGDPDLYPAIVINLDGYSNGVAFWEDGEECWVIRCDGDNGELSTGDEMTAARMGVNYDDGMLILVVNSGQSPGTVVGYDQIPCLVFDGADPVGLAQRWWNPTTGEVWCRTSGACGCPPDTPPDPETSCCPLWFCDTVLGPVEVSADATGLYTPPANWDGNRPHETEAAAEAVCGLKWWCVGTNQPLVEAPLSNPPEGYTEGPFDTEAEADAACPLLFGDCATEYSRTLVVTHTGFSGGCSGYNGSVNLPWDGTKWTGTYAAPAGNVTYDITPGAFSGGTANWTKAYTSSAYTLTGWGGVSAVGCGSLPAGGVLTLSGGCSGGGTVGITQL